MHTLRPQQRTVLLALALTTGSLLVASARPSKTLEECARPLADFCKPERCPTYDEAVRRVRELVRRPRWHEYRRAEAGRCGEWRYVSRDDGYTSETLYFDAEGRLLVADSGSDTNEFCSGTSLAQTYGPPVKCTHESTESLLPRRCATVKDLAQLVTLTPRWIPKDACEKVVVDLRIEGDLEARPFLAGAAGDSLRWEAGDFADEPPPRIDLTGYFEPQSGQHSVAFALPVTCGKERGMLRATIEGVETLCGPLTVAHTVTMSTPLDQTTK